MKSLIARCAVACLVLLPVLSGCGGRQNIKLTGIYSDLAIHSETGDLLGQEIIIVLSNRGYYAIVQLSEGEPMVPQISKISNLENGKISFDFKNGSGQTVTFVGTVSATHLAGVLNRESPITLRRRHSYWE